MLAACATTAVPTSSGEALAAAEAALAEGRPAEAREILLPLRGRSPELDALLGDACFAAGEWDEAERAWRSVRESAPAPLRVRANMGLGSLAERRRDFHLAMRRFDDARAAAATDETRYAALRRYGLSAIEAGDRVRAASALASLPGGHPARGEIEEALLRRGMGPVRTAAPSRPGDPGFEPAAIRAGSPPVPVAILGRHEWGARAVRPAGDPEPMGPVRRITIHHTATAGKNGAARSEAVALLRSIQFSHQSERLWADIGYHYLIDAAGRVWEGRVESLQGAHAGNREANRGNLGVALLGDFERSAPGPEQEAALVGLLATLCHRHGIDPSRIQGHGDVAGEFRAGGTSCPGRQVRDRLPDLRRRVRQAVD